MMFMQDGVEMETIFGDGSASQSGLMGKLMGAGKRLLTGESLFTTIYANQADGKRRVAFSGALSRQDHPAGPEEHRRHPDLPEGFLLLRRKGRLAWVLPSRSRLGVGFFGGEGFILQKLEGDGMVFFHAGGTLAEKTWRRAKSCGLIPAAWPPCSPRWTSTFSLSAS
jgi:uncharacterized protein (AIM24 family)